MGVYIYIGDNGMLSRNGLISEFKIHFFAICQKKAKKVHNRNKTVTFGLHNHTYR